jgi:RHS repeat-associated protein
LDAETGDQDYGMRIYNSNLGRFLSIDPLSREFAWNSVYSFAENDVIRSIDLDGAEKYIQITTFNHTKDNKPVITKYDWSHFFPSQKNGPMGEIGTVKLAYFKSTKSIYYIGSDVSSKDIMKLAYENISTSVVKTLNKADGLVNGVKGDPYYDDFNNAKPYSFEAGGRVSSNTPVIQGKIEAKLTAKSESEITPELSSELAGAYNSSVLSGLTNSSKVKPFTLDFFAKVSFTAERQTDFSISQRLSLPNNMYIEFNTSIDIKDIKPRLQALKVGFSPGPPSIETNITSPKIFSGSTKDGVGGIAAPEKLKD